MDMTTNDTRYDKLLFMYQYLKNIEPYIVNVARHYPEEGGKYLKEYIDELKFIQGEMAEEVADMKSRMTDVPKGNRKEFLRHARETIKKELGGFLYFLDDPIEILPDTMFPEEELTVSSLVHSHEGGAKHHYKKQAGERAKNTAKRVFNSAKQGRNRGSTVRRRETHLFSLFLKFS
jgi:hypothetical protein